MYKITPTMTPAEVQAAQQKLADYCRLRHRPNKKCVDCGQTFPNDRAHFAANQNGRLLGRCLTCIATSPAKANPLAEPCPCCGEPAKLVRDRTMPDAMPVKVCRRCLQAVSLLTDVTAVTRANLLAYVDWRKERAGG